MQNFKGYSLKIFPIFHKKIIFDENWYEFILGNSKHFIEDTIFHLSPI